jgi:hypothetical protein
VRQVTVFTAAGCHLCEAALEVVESVGRETPFALRLVDITGDPDLERRYRTDLPVVEIDGTRAFRHFVVADELRRLLACPAIGSGPRP